MMRRNLFVSIIFVMLFINCNKGDSMETNKNLKAEENNESVSKNRSCKELEKYSINSEKIELKNKNLEEINCILNYRNVKELDLRWNRINDLKPLEKLEKIETQNVISNISNTYAKPRVFIPVFPGTNSEYDLERAFNREGGLAKIGVFNNLSHSNILSSIDNFVKEINNSQILMLPGGFSAGDEPDGSAKFMVAVLKNKKVKEAVENLLKRDGLILGICNGFQALIKSGLLPYGEIRELNENSPTLTFNTIDKHMSKIVQTKIITNNSPWLANMKEGDIHSVAISHGEGRVIITEEQYKKLFENNQIATKYVGLDGNSTMDSQFNPNGSYYAIEGMLAHNGRIFGKMGHSERKGKNVYKNIYGNKEQNIFRNGIKFFK